VVVDVIAEELRSLSYQKAQELDIAIEALDMIPDHVQLFMHRDPAEALERLANQFKS